MDCANSFVSHLFCIFLATGLKVTISDFLKFDSAFLNTLQRYSGALFTVS